MLKLGPPPEPPPDIDAEPANDAPSLGNTNLSMTFCEASFKVPTIFFLKPNAILPNAARASVTIAIAAICAAFPVKSAVASKYLIISNHLSCYIFIRH